MSSPLADQAYCSTLIALAAADEHGVTPAERTTIDRISVELGIPEQSRAAAWAASPGAEEVLSALEHITDPARRRTLLKDMVLLAFADGEFSAQERAFVEKVRARMGLEPAFLTRVVDWVNRGAAWLQEGVELCEPRN